MTDMTDESVRALLDEMTFAMFGDGTDDTISEKLARALIASEAARKLAEERLREAELAFENVDAQVDDEGEFSERSWEQLRATLKEIDNG